MEEYVGCRIEQNEKDQSIRFTQLVLLQSYGDKFKILDKKPTTPAEDGTTLVHGAEGSKVGGKRHTYYQSGVGKLLHMSRWSRPEVQNAVRELSRHSSMPTEAHIKAMHQNMEYF